MTRINSKELEEMVRVRKELAIVLFSGVWCMDCRNFEPTWRAWTYAHSGPIYRLEISRGGPEWEEWEIDEVPTVVAYSGDSVLDKVHGSISEEGLDRLWKRLAER